MRPARGPVFVLLEADAERKEMGQPRGRRVVPRQAPASGRVSWDDHHLEPRGEMRAVNKRRTTLLVCLGMFLAGLAVVPAAQGAAANCAGSPTVIVGTSNDSYPPFEIPIANGTKSIGFDNDLVTAIARQAGFKVEFRTFAWGYIATPPGPWADCDMVAAAVTPAPFRRAFMRFSDLYFDEPPHGPLAFAFPKSRAGADLCATVNAALRQVKDDGTWAKIYIKWFDVAPTSIP